MYKRDGKARLKDKTIATSVVYFTCRRRDLYTSKGTKDLNKACITILAAFVFFTTSPVSLSGESTPLSLAVDHFCAEGKLTVTPRF